MTDKVFEININENIEVVIDSRFKIKGFIEFIRLSFNRMEIKDGEYKIYFDKNNVRKHKLLLYAIANMYKKHKNSDDSVLKKLLLNYKKDLIVKIKKYSLTYDEKAVYITIRKISSKEFEILFANPKPAVFNYIKGLFLFDLIDYSKERFVIMYNEESQRIVSALAAKNTVMGYRVVFNIDENEFSYTKNFNVEGSLKEYLNKIRNALDLFGVSTIYEFDKIKREYRRLAKKYHPDLHRQKPDLIQKIYAKKFARVKESFELLEEYYLRKSYEK
ncbi:DnaJ domain-containing protein [Nautilia sp.]